MSVIVIQFITLDGIVSDPDGSGGPPTYLEWLSAEPAGAAVLTRSAAPPPH
ncbi:hypothetical protein Acor_75140 [Acrocarpospora corrugata]|uniref:Uncharacterized protein n=1 Tax=Acrocarpospora corrugata TaxID=35763 RepID=A0A5M3W9D1_9ACTN|nr:hypothetical protein [Acrocarpospora corrugata]GES05446.1 hypothetical protein Acor_75140 [Acrocarpospora corrugata]